MRALGALAERNQDRVTYAMTFTFKSDQDQNWERTFTIDQSNWFEQQVIDVSKCLLPTILGYIYRTGRKDNRYLPKESTTYFVDLNIS